jgi:antitoxin Phd
VSKTWALQDAKTQFSELVERAKTEPQVVTKHGKNAAVVLSFEAYQRLLPQRTAWDALRPPDTLLEDDPTPFQRAKDIHHPLSFDDAD